MTTTEWIGRYNAAFELAVFDQGVWDRRQRYLHHPTPIWNNTKTLADRLRAAERCSAETAAYFAKVKLPPELLPDGYVELGHGLRVEWDEQNKRYKLADPK